MAETTEKTIKQFKGKYINATGRRKSATSQIRLYKSGAGEITVNGKKIDEYFTEEELKAVVWQPLKLTGQTNNLNISVIVHGGGKNGQAEAIRHGISLALIELNSEFRPSLKAKGMVSRDSRKKERKKPGLKKARRAPQWSKR